MIRLERHQTEDEIFAHLSEIYSKVPVLPNLPVIIRSNDSMEMSVHYLNNVRKLCKIISLSFRGDKAIKNNWHAFLDITVAGFTILHFTASDDVKLPEIFDLPIQGTC